MQKNNFSKLLKEDLRLVVKSSWSQLLGIGILIWFLLFLLNIFLWVSLYTNNLSDTLKDRLGMYFYIKDVPWQETIVYKEIITMKDELEAKWLKVMFSSKEDALGFLQKKIPDLIDNFKKYGIENPLPATLYVMFDNDNKYQALRTIILDHKDLILNIKDVDNGKTLKQQENRVLNIINLSNFIMNVSYAIITVLCIIILLFIGFLLNSLFAFFRKDFEIKKVMWVSHINIVKTFMTIVLWVIVVAYVINIVLLLMSGTTINYYLTTLFDVRILDVFQNLWLVLWFVIWQIVLFVGASIGISYRFTNSLNKRN